MLSAQHSLSPTLFTCLLFTCLTSRHIRVPRNPHFSWHTSTTVAKEILFFKIRIRGVAALAALVAMARRLWPCGGQAAVAERWVPGAGLRRQAILLAYTSVSPAGGGTGGGVSLPPNSPPGWPSNMLHKHWLSVRMLQEGAVLGPRHPARSSPKSGQLQLPAGNCNCNLSRGSSLEYKRYSPSRGENARPHRETTHL